MVAERAVLLQTAHGHHSLAVAHRLLLIEALQDPLNQRFQLLCPATIPVRPAQFTYEQLLAQKKSRVGNYVWWQVRPTGPRRHVLSGPAILRRSGATEGAPHLMPLTKSSILHPAAPGGDTDPSDTSSAPGGAQREGVYEADTEAIRTTVPGRFPLPMMEEWPGGAQARELPPPVHHADPAPRAAHPQRHLRLRAL